MMKNCAIVLLALLGSVSAISVGKPLDPKVFEAMASMSMPPVGNLFNTDFEFKTSNNKLLEANSHNATYFSNEVFVYLMIPLDQVVMKGDYVSSLRVYMNGQTVVTQNNSGSYILLLQGVNLRVKINIDFGLHGPKLLVEDNACITTIQGIEMMLRDNEDGENTLGINTVRELIEFISFEEYKKMFCSAMRLVAASGVHSPIGRAILDRMETAFTGK